MVKLQLLFIIVMVLFVFSAAATEPFETDTYKTSAGNLKITFIGHGTLMFTFVEKVIHVDPWQRLADYSALPKADLILSTHDHRDHFDPEAIKLVRTPKTVLVCTEISSKRDKSGVTMKNGDERTFLGMKIEAVPAYNILHKRDSGDPYHVKGEDNGYVITFGDMRVYVAGDTDNIPEMKNLKDIDIAFLPMNLPYTMTPEMVADCARVFRPKILYPYHYGETNPLKLVELLKNEKDIEVRIRNLQ